MIFYEAKFEKGAHFFKFLRTSLNKMSKKPIEITQF